MQESATLAIRVQNRTDRIQYVADPGYWLHSETSQVRNFDPGEDDPAAELALYTNQPTCEQIASGDPWCGGHSDRPTFVLALAPGAESVQAWDAQVWRRERAPDGKDCHCMTRVAAPPGAYALRLGVGSTTLDDDACDPGNGFCESVGGAVVAEREIEARFSWPEETEISIVLE